MSAKVVSGKKRCPMLLLLKLLIQLAVAAADRLQTSAAQVVFQPQWIHDLPEGSNQTVTVSVRVPSDEFERKQFGDPWNLTIRSFRSDVATCEQAYQLDKSSFELDNATRYYKADKPITIVGHQLGKTGMRVRLVPAKDWLEIDYEGDNYYNENSPSYRRSGESESMLDVWVLRSGESQKLTTIFVASVVVLISLANVMMGCELDLNTVLATIKRPIAPAIGLFTQFCLMPLLAYIIAVTIFTPRGLYSMALGIFITGCAPAGGASNFWTLLLDGNVNLSVTMTFISTMASLVMMPLWIHLLAKPFLQGFSSGAIIKVPYANIVRSLASLVVPLLIGVGIQKWKPAWAAKARKVMRPFVIFVLVFVVVFGSISNWYMFRMMNWPALLGGLMLPWCGFMFGCFTALVTRRQPPDVTAIAIETGIQNTGIAILLLKASFAQPDSDIGAVLPVIVACFTPFPLLFGAAVHHTIKYIKKRREIKSQPSDVEKPPMIVLEKVEEDKSSTALLKEVKGSGSSVATSVTTSGIGTSGGSIESSTNA